jgi:hypothetical protein
LGLDSYDEQTGESIPFMEDYIHSKLHFKAIHIDLRSFDISLEGSDLDDIVETIGDNDLRIRWWAIPAQEKEEQTGEPVPDKEKRKKRHLFFTR